LLIHLIPWVVVAPCVFLAVDRFPLDREQWKTSLPVHVALCAICTFAIALINHLLGFAMPPPPFPGGEFPRGFAPGNQSWSAFAFFHARFHLPAYCTVVLAAQAWRFRREAREKKQRAIELEALLAQARIHHLHAQLQPHFLFNALHAISGLVHTAPESADEMIATLSELLRRTLRDGSRTEVALREEIEVLELYLDLQRIRFGDRLVVHRDIAPELLEAAVPGMLIQPLVENAVKHGLEKRDRPLQLSITVRREEASLYLEIVDDGPGLGTVSAPLREGIGLGNTRARLALLYGTNQSLSLTNRADGAGACLACHLPFRLMPKNSPYPGTSWPFEL
jgi:two-component system LytT family sensor kinase